MADFRKWFLALLICSLFLVGFCGACPGPPEQQQTAVQTMMSFIEINLAAIPEMATVGLQPAPATRIAQSTLVNADRQNSTRAIPFPKIGVVALLKCPLPARSLDC